MEKLTAKQAAELSKLKERPLDDVLKVIKQQAENYGERYILERHIAPEVLTDLINLGYTISRHEDPFGVEQMKVRW